MAKLIAIDIGSRNIRVYMQRGGVALREPAAIALEADGGKILYAGREAVCACDRLPGALRINYPLAPDEPEQLACSELLHSLLGKIETGFFFIRPGFVVGMPRGSSIEVCGTVCDSLLHAGAGEVACVDAALAAALGAGMDIDSESARIVVLIGAMRCETACICHGAIISSGEIKIGGDALDRALDVYLREKFNLICLSDELERLKLELGGVHPSAPQNTGMARGIKSGTGMPALVELTTALLNEAYLEEIGKLAASVLNTINEVPEELRTDIGENGITLCGGGAKLGGLAALIGELTGMKCCVAQDPEECVINGLGDMTETPDYPFNFVK